MTRKNVFIDLDGTLVNIAPRHHRVYTFCVDYFGGKPLPIADYWSLKRRDARWSEVLALSGLDAAIEPEFLRLFIGRIESAEELLKDKLFPESLAALEELSRDNTLYLLSLRRNKEALNQEVNNLGIRRYFKEILSGHSDTKAGTLNKKAEVIRSTGVDTDSVIIIGDTEADVAAAQQLGVVSVALGSGVRNRKFLEAMHPTYLLPGIGQVKDINF